MKATKGLCDSCSESTRPALVAARDGHVNCLIFACDSLGLANERDGYSATPLHFSARHGHLECVEWIVRHNVISPTSVTRGGTTPAHDAAATGQIECLKFLLSNSKCSLNDRTVEGSTMLHMACRFGRLPMVKWLVGENGVSPNETGVNNVTPVHICAAKDNVKCLQWLTHQPQYIPNMETIHGATPTYFAAQEGCFKCLDWLVDHAKGDPKIAAKDGMLPMHAAAQAGHLDCIKLLISRGLGTVNELSKDGGTPVHFSAAGGHSETLTWLIRNGGIVNVKDNCRSTPLHDAAEQGQASTVRILLESGSDVRAMDDECFSPLDLAEESGSVECIHLLRAAVSGQGVPPSLHSPQLANQKVVMNRNLETQGYPQRDFDFLSSPTEVEIQTPKQRRRGRFNFNFLRGNSFFSRRSTTSLDNDMNRGRKTKKATYYSSPNSGNQSQTDMLANETPTTTEQQTPLMKNALISSKSPEVIRVVRQMKETASESPRFTPEALRRSLTETTINNPITSPNLTRSTEWTRDSPKKEKQTAKSREIEPKLHREQVLQFQAWAHYQSNQEEHSSVSNLKIQEDKHNRIYAVSNPLIMSAVEDILEDRKPKRGSIELFQELKEDQVKEPVVLQKVSYLSEIPVADATIRESKSPVIPPKPVLSREQLMKLGDDNSKINDVTISVPIQADRNVSCSKRSLSLVDERDEMSRTSTFSTRKGDRLVNTHKQDQLIPQPAADQKRANASYLSEVKHKRIETLEAVSLALLGPPLLGLRRVNKFFIGIGNDPGIHCWKVGPVSNRLTEIVDSGPLSGHFHVLDVYLFLHTSSHGPVFHQIHVWKGHLADWTIYEKATTLSHELSNSLSGVSQIYKEIQGLESCQFMSCFSSRVLYYHQSINKPFSQSCLYELSGTHILRCTQSSLGIKQFQPTLVYYLISQKTMYIWVGMQASELLKISGYNNALGIREKERMTSFLVIDPSQRNEAFNSALRIVERQSLKSFPQIYQSLHSSIIPVKYYRTMFSEGKRAGYREIRYSPIIFDQNEVIFIVMSVRLTVWVGHNKRLQAQDFLGMAQSLLKTCFYPELLPCVVLHEFGEDSLFDHQFCDREKPNLSLLDTETRNELNILSAPVPSMHDAGLGRIKIYEINASGKREQPIAEFGHFKSVYCYFVLYSYRREIKFLSLIYIWVGNEASDNIIRNQDIQLRELQAKTPGDQAIIYIPQGMETDHFLSLFKTKFIVHQSSFTRSFQDNTISLYRIFSYNLLSIKAMQVETQASSLISNSAFVLSSPAKSIVWIGQTTSQNDRRGAMLIAKELKTQEPLTLMEGEENDRFWSQLGGKQAYPPLPREHWPLHNALPLLYHFYKGIKPVFTPIPNFTQRDLITDSVFILDTSSYIFIWHGARVEPLNSKAIVQDYLVQISPEKSIESLVLLSLQQGAEPSSFTSLFPAWNDSAWKDAEIRLSYILASKPILKQPVIKQGTSVEAKHFLSQPDLDSLDNNIELKARAPKEYDRGLPAFIHERRRSSSASVVITPEPFTIQAELVKDDLMKEINELDEVLKSFELGTVISVPDTQYEQGNRKKMKLEALRRGEFSKFIGKSDPAEELDTDTLIQELDSTMQQVNRNVLNEERRRSRTYSNPDDVSRTRANTDLSLSSVTPHHFSQISKVNSSTEILDTTEQRDRNESFISMSGSSTGVPTQLSLVSSPLMLKKSQSGKRTSPGVQRKSFNAPGPIAKQDKSAHTSTTQPSGIGAWAPSVVTREGHYKPPPPSDKNIQEISKQFKSNVQSKIAKTKAKSPIAPASIFSGAPTEVSGKFRLSVDLEITGQTVELVIKRGTLAQNVVFKVVEKCRCKLTPSLSLFEVHTVMNLERKLEDHELVLDVVHQWPSNAVPSGDSKLVVRDYLDKYGIMGSVLSIDDIEISIREQSLPRLKTELIMNRTVPNDSSGDEKWTKATLEFKMDGIYFWQDAKTLRCISQYSTNQLYTFVSQDTDVIRTPAPYAFALKPLNSWNKDNLHIFCTEEREIFSACLGYITIGMFGLKPLYKDWQTMRKQFSQLLELKTRSGEDIP